MVHSGNGFIQRKDKMLLLLLHILIVFWIFSRSNLFRVYHVSPFVIPTILFLKVLGGFLIAKYYLSTYNGGDIFGYLSDAHQFQLLFKSSPRDFFKLMFGCNIEGESINIFYSKLTTWFTSGYSSQYNDARSVIRFHALLGIFSNGNEWIHLIWSNVLCVAGMLALMRFFFYEDANTGTIPSYVFLIFFLPNVFIWSSSILKEPLLIFALGMTLRYFQLWNMHRNLIYGLSLLFFIFCFVLIKSFWLLVLIPGLIIWMVFPKMKHPFKTIGFSYLCLLILVLTIGEFWPLLNLPDLLFGQQRNMWRFAVFMKAGSLVHPVPFSPDVMSFLKHIPDAFAYGMFQPMPWQLAKWFYFPLFLENLMFPFVWMVVFWKMKTTSLKINPPIIIAFIAGFIIVLISAYTTPVIGTLIRYRMPGLLLMILALLSMIGNSIGRKSGASAI